MCFSRSRKSGRGETKRGCVCESQKDKVLHRNEPAKVVQALRKEDPRISLAPVGNLDLKLNRV